MGIWYFLSYLDIFFRGLWLGHNLGSWVRPDSFAHLAASEIVELQNPASLISKQSSI